MADQNETNESGNDMTQEELEQQAQQAVEDGRAMQKITQLLQDNYEQREQLRQLRDQQPSDDQVVLDQDQAEQLREVGALSDDGEVQADQLQERLQEGEEAQEQLQAYRRREQRRQVYEAEGLNEEAAEDILPDDLDFEVEEGEGEDEESQAFVQTEDGRTPVSEYIEESFSKPIQQALTGEVGSEDDSGSTTADVPNQTPAGEDSPGGNGDTVESFIEQRNQERTGATVEEE